MEHIKITRTATVGNTTYYIVRYGRGTRYAFVMWDGMSHQHFAWDYHGTGRWYGTIDYIADWVSYTTARRRFVLAVDDATLVDDIVHASRYDAEMADYDSDHLIPLAL